MPLGLVIGALLVFLVGLGFSIIYFRIYTDLNQKLENLKYARVEPDRAEVEKLRHDRDESHHYMVKAVIITAVALAVVVILPLVF